MNFATLSVPSSYDHAPMSGHGFGGRDFGALLADELPALRMRAQYLHKAPAPADDLVQDTLVRALANRHRFTPGSRLRSWLFRIMNNLFIDECRSRRKIDRRDPAELELAAPEPDEAPSWEVVTIEDVRAALARLSPSMRRTFELVYLEGKSYVEAARETGVPPRTVGTRLLRARRRMLKWLVRDEGGAAPGP